VNRSALTELGASYIVNGHQQEWFGRATTQQFAAPDFDSDKKSGLVFSDFLNLFIYNSKEGVGAVIMLLQTKGLFQSLAETSLVAESGKEASFLAGGEIPVPVAQGTGGNVAISVQWKEFGIRLNFTPTVIGERINLKVRPEVSTLDFNNAIVLQGFRIPALSTRRAETEIELMNQQTFAIAGLMNNAMTQQLQKIPGIGDIPVLGLLFQSKAARKEQTELVVMITPEILPPNSPGLTRELPRMQEPYMGPLAPNKSFPEPPAAFRPSGSGATNGTQPVDVAHPDPATAAAAVQPVTKDERNALERTRQEERAQGRATTHRKAEEDKRDMKLAAEQQRKDREGKARLEQQVREGRVREEKLARVEKERQARLAQEQAKRDAEQAKRDAEVAKRQAEVDREHQKQIDDAAAKLKAAEEAYQAQLAKRSNNQSSSPQ